MINSLKLQCKKPSLFLDLKDMEKVEVIKQVPLIYKPIISKKLKKRLKIKSARAQNLKIAMIAT